MILIIIVFPKISELAAVAALETFWRRSRHSAKSRENIEEFGEVWLRGRDLNPE